MDVERMQQTLGSSYADCCLSALLAILPLAISRGVDLSLLTFQHVEPHLNNATGVSLHLSNVKILARTSRPVVVDGLAGQRIRAWYQRCKHSEPSRPFFPFSHGAWKGTPVALEDPKVKNAWYANVVSAAEQLIPARVS